MRQEKREAVVKSFTVPNKTATAGSKDDKENPMVMLLSLQVRLEKASARESWLFDALTACHTVNRQEPSVST